MKLVKHDILVVEENCTGCYRCERTCPTNAITMVGPKSEALAVVEQAACVSCMRCIDVCPDDALLAVERAEPKRVGTKASSADPAALQGLCDGAGLDPNQMACLCSSTRVKELAAAALAGARTFEALALATGASSGCLLYCSVPMRRILRASTGGEIDTSASKGSALIMTVAGTPYRQDAVRYVADLPRTTREPEERNIAAVVRREPTNVHDKNAVRVLVDGVHIGFLPKRDAQRWQSVLVECERRQMQLVGSVRLLGGENGDELAASIGLRDGLEGFEGSVTKQREATKAKAATDRAKKVKQRAESVALLTGDVRASVLTVLERLARQQPVRTKQNAGLVVRQVRDLLPVLRGHADALEAAQPPGSPSELPYIDALDNLEGLLDDMLDAADADEREDLHDEIQDQIADLISELSATG